MKEKTEEIEYIFSTNNLSPISIRVRSLINLYAKGSVKRFSEMIELSNSQKLNRVFNVDKRSGRYPDISADILLSIANMFPMISRDWLLTGKGEMLKPDGSSSPVVNNIAHEGTSLMAGRDISNVSLPKEESRESTTDTKKESNPTKISDIQPKISELEKRMNLLEKELILRDKLIARQEQLIELLSKEGKASKSD
jgi:hypothetical protein